MKQRVGIARALAMEPKILLLDEPFGALDALTRAHLQDAVMEIHARLGNTMIMITHDVDEAVLLSDRIVMMTNGPAARIGEGSRSPDPAAARPHRALRRPHLSQIPRSRAEVPLRTPPLRRSRGVSFMAQKLVIIGNGMAPGRMLEHLFEQAPGLYDVTIFNAEPRVNYDRIMLSPVLSGEKTFEDIIIHGDGWYIENNVTLYKGHRIVDINRNARTVTSDHGVTESYDKLVIATGSVPFIIPVPGKDLPGVITYRDLDDVDAMLLAAQSREKAIVIGGGLLGLEAAAGLALRGMDVTVLHVMPTLMERQLDPAAGYLLQKAVEERGIKVITKANTKRIIGTDRVEGIELDNGTIIPATLVVMAVGIRPMRALPRTPALRSIAASWSMPACRPLMAISSRSANAPKSTAWSMASSRRSTKWPVWPPPIFPAIRSPPSSIPTRRPS